MIPGLPRRRHVLAALAGLTAAGLTPSGAAWAARGQKRPAWLGVEMGKAEGGVLAKRVLRSSPAERGGIKAGDLLLTVGGKQVSSSAQIIRAVSESDPGTALKIGLRRGKEDREVTVTLGEFPGEEEVLRLDKVGTSAAAWKGGVAAQGDVTDLKKLKGRVVLVDFWASWCVACRLTTPVMNDLHDRFAAQGLTVVGLTEDAEDVALKAIGKLGIKYPVLAATSNETLGDYGVRSLPTFFAIDKRGVIREVFLGALPVEPFEKVVQKLLKEPAPT